MGGCCNKTQGNYPTNKDISEANTLKDLINALTKIKKAYTDELNDISSHLNHHTLLKTEDIQGMNDATLKKRSGHLINLTESCQELITSLHNTAGGFPVDQGKEILNQWAGNYYLAYDENRSYLKQENDLKRLANTYKANP